jgi:enoyl-CoA hydratase
MSAVHLILNGPLAEVCLDNPAKMNALTIDMLNQLDRHWTMIDKSDDIRCVIIPATDDRAFCTGADINVWGDLSPAGFVRSRVRNGHRIFDCLARMGKPTIAALSGHAFGGG